MCVFGKGEAPAEPFWNPQLAFKRLGRSLALPTLSQLPTVQRLNTAWWTTCPSTS